jgi:phenylpropionate dioxygenase-like ring-hydroxylating dioxygenase large terminal subunit
MVERDTERSYAAVPYRRPRGQPIPGEGDDGLYTQSWYPICLSSDLPTGGVVGTDFLGGRAVAFRGATGIPHVISAYCVHLGADLSVGKVSGDHIRCAFHGWEYNGEGACVATGGGDPVPASAHLYRFPTTERYGIIWAFNGDQPLFAIPEHYREDQTLVQRTVKFDQQLNVDPWVISAQTLDLQHFSLTHEGNFVEDPNDSLDWRDYSVGYHYHARMPGGGEYKIYASIHGTNIFWQVGQLNGSWFYWITGIGLSAPSRSSSFFSWGTVLEPGQSKLAAEQFLSEVHKFMMNLLVEDAPILTSIHYTPGLLTDSDEALGNFFEYLAKFPRGNPAQEFIR